MLVSKTLQFNFCMPAWFKGTNGSMMICISPLTAFMMDQATKHAQLGIKTEFVGECQKDPAVVEKVLKGEVQLIYISPESIVFNSRYRDMLRSPKFTEKLIGIAVDEAHCIKTWGDKFRIAYSLIGELRSLVPKSINVMALTATATTETFEVITMRLSMSKLVVIASTPDHGNIFYSVVNETNIQGLADDLAEKLKTKRCAFLKTVLFVRTYQHCANIYMFLKKKMKDEFTEPPGYPNMSGYRLVDMYTRVATPEKKDELLKAFCTIGGKLRLIIATTAFGLGIDCPDIQQIIHWGLPDNIEEYVQQSGRGGPNGSNSTAILYRSKGARYGVQQCIKRYVSNSSTCRRRLLFKHFLCYSEAEIAVNGCKCCDVCMLSCKCMSCRK